MNSHRSKNGFGVPKSLREGLAILQTGGPSGGLSTDSRSHPLSPCAAATVLCLIAALFAGCSHGPNPNVRRPVEAPTVVVTSYPLQYFSDRISQGGCKIVFPIRAASAPGEGTPDEQELRQIQEAERIFTNGPEPVEWLAKADVPPERVVDTTHIFEKFLLRTNATSATASRPDADDSAPYDRLTWLNPRLAIHQAETCFEALARLTPTVVIEYQRNSDGLLEDLEKLDAELSRISAEYGNEPLLAAAPKFNYLGRRCALNLKSLDWPLDRMPEETSWNELRTILTTHPAKWMLWPCEPLPEVAKRLKTMGVECIVFDPCELPSSEGDYLETMRENYKRLERMFQSLAAAPVRSALQGLPRDLKLPGEKGPASAPLPEAPRGVPTLQRPDGEKPVKETP